jgi:hypothetical protein
VTNADEPDVVARLIKTRDARYRPAEEGRAFSPTSPEVTATIQNFGDAIAGETTARFWVRGEHVDRELASSTPLSCRLATKSRSPLSGTFVTAQGSTRSLFQRTRFRRLTSSARTTTDAIVPVTVRANRVEQTYWSDLEQRAKCVALDLTS